MDILEDTCEKLKALDLTRNHCDFSTAWLSKSRRYYSMIRSSGRNPSVDALGRLAANLKQRHEFYKTSRLGELRCRAELIFPLVRKAWTELYNRALER